MPGVQRRQGQMSQTVTKWRLWQWSERWWYHWWIISSDAYDYDDDDDDKVGDSHSYLDKNLEEHKFGDSKNVYDVINL